MNSSHEGYEIYAVHINVSRLDRQGKNGKFIPVHNYAIKLYAMKIYEGVEVWLSLFLTSALGEGS
jgi:hypothetical protein